MARPGTQVVRSSPSWSGAQLGTEKGIRSSAATRGPVRVSRSGIRLWNEGIRARSLGYGDCDNRSKRATKIKGEATVMGKHDNRSSVPLRSLYQAQNSGCDNTTTPSCQRIPGRDGQVSRTRQSTRIARSASEVRARHGPGPIPTVVVDLLCPQKLPRTWTAAPREWSVGATRTPAALFVFVEGSELSK